jgi:hypothetical protein
MSRSSSTTPLIPYGAFPAAASCWPPIHRARSGRSTPMPWGCSTSHRDAGPCASYALSGPRTPACADSARASFSPGLLSGPRPSVRTDKRRARLISPPDLGQGGVQRDRNPARLSEHRSVQHPSLSERSERFGRGGPRGGTKCRARTGGGQPLFPHPRRHLECSTFAACRPGDISCYGTASPSPGSCDQSVTYDPNGNITSKSDVGGTSTSQRIPMRSRASRGSGPRRTSMMRWAIRPSGPGCRVALHGRWLLRVSRDHRAGPGGWGRPWMRIGKRMRCR